MWLPPSDIQMVIDRGIDWRPQYQAVLDQFDRSSAEARPSSMWHYRSRSDGTTRAVNIYKGEHRGFNYLSPKIRLEPRDLLECSPASPPQLPDWIHLICSPERALETISQIDDILSQQKATGTAVLPKLVYEPIPDSCVFENLQDCLRVLPRLAVFSPNHEEAAQLLDLHEDWELALQQATADKDCTRISSCGSSQTSSPADSRSTCSDHRRARRLTIRPHHLHSERRLGVSGGSSSLGFRHVRAWHTASDSSPTSAEGSETGDETSLNTSASQIKDVTGAGNSFLGGFSACLVQTEEEDAEIR